ncbi:hypothetical protein QYE76_002316 [Lolium multiflorum]|uniref:Uncharacterized protein n=1 Tax=Lolium multiflorum TaxID=4521 RepID=A0AAD8RQD2_LOLMU|nr:hypothetical protein QYE76_002316 [Lolium multiflorum]
MAAEDLEWERSKISNQDLNMMKKLGLMKKEDAIRFPSEESYPNPPMEYRVSFVDHLIRGLSAPIHDFLHGLLFVYGIQLHQTILLWLLFLPFLRMEKSKNKLSLPKTIKVLLFMKVKSQPMIKDLIRIGSQFIGYREYASKTEEKLAEANNRADALVQKLEQSEAARKKAELVASEAKAEADEAKAKVASVEELQKRLEDAESALNEHKTAQAAREEVILKRLKSQIRRTETQTNQGFDLENPVNDPLLDTLSYLELHGSEIREGVANASAGLSTLFPYFFPKKEEPPTFLTLAKSFNSSEDLGLKMRQENMKLIFDNYTSIPGPSEVFPSSLSKKSSVPVNLDDSSSMDLTEELKELRVQLQSVKKQSLMLMEQSRESSQREKIALQQAQDAMTEKDAAVAEAAAATSRENSMLQLLIDASLDMAGAFLDTATEDERVEARSNVLLRLAREHGSTFWGTPERTRQIVRFQDRALQVREYLDFCTRTLSLVYGTMFPRNKMPDTLPALMDKFRDAPRIHGFVRAQLAAGARFAMIMIKICYPKLDVGQIVPKCLEKMSKKKRNFGKYDDIVTPVAEDMMDELLRMDSEFFVKGSYAEHSTRAVNNERLTIDNILGNP